MTPSLCENDYTFGPGASCRSLDFTIFFENIFLAFVPALIVIGLTLTRFTRLFGKQRKLLPYKQLPLSGITLIASKALIGLITFATSLAFWITSKHSQWSDWAANASQTIATLLVVILALVEHLKSNRPSQAGALFLLVNAPFLGARLRTVSLTNSDGVASLSAYLASTVLFFIALQISTRTSLINGHELPPTATAGLVSRYFVSWVLPLLWRGYKTPLNLSTLGSIDNHLHSKPAWSAFDPHWRKQVQRYKDGKTKLPLLVACFQTFKWPFLAPVIPFIISSVSALGRPLIVNRTVLFVESFSTSNPNPLADGYGIIGAAFLVYLVYALSTAMAHVGVQRSSIALRGALMEALYRKSLVIRVESAREMGSAKANNLMSVDVDSIVRTVIGIHEFWTALAMTGLAMYIIYTQVGISVVATVVGAVLFFAALPLLTRKVASGRTAYGKATDVRVKFMTSLIRHIKAVKMSAYEVPAIKCALEMRQDEITKLKVWIKEILKVSILTNYLDAILSVATITTFTLVSIFSSNGQAVGTARIFTVISTISVISEPLLMLGQRLGSLITAWANLRRVEEFLLLEERETRELQDMSPGIQPLECLPVKTPGDERDCIVEFDDATFGVRDKATILKGLNVHQRNPSLWMIVGHVGSGKSTMLQAIISELDLLSGSATTKLGQTGYCSQDPWLTTNNSIRDNITFMHPFDAEWYRTVIKAVALDIDLKIIKGGDTVTAGNLSGGQKQRVALARAVYGRFPTLVLDDVFSALDADTEARVFKALFGADGLLKHTSVILATNQVHRFSDASYLTVLENGAIAEQGDYNTLLAQNGHITRWVDDFASGKKVQKEEKEMELVERAQSIEHPDALTEIVDANSVKEKQEGATGAVKWSTYGWYLRGMGAVYATFWIGSVIAAAATQLSTNIYLQAWTSNLAGASKAKFGAFLGGYAGIQIGYFFAFSIGILYAFLFAHPLVSINLHAWQIKGLLAASLEYFESRQLGEIVNRFNSDLNMIDMTLPNHAVNCMYSIANIIGSAILIVIAGPYNAAVIAGTLALMIFLQRFYVRGGRELRRLDLTSKSPIYTLFSETIDADGLRTIRAMQAQNTCMDMMTKRATASQHPFWLLLAVQKWLELALNLASLIVNTVLVLVAVENRNKTSSGILAVAMSQAANLNLMFIILIVEWTNVEMCITSVERIQEYIELPPQENLSLSRANLDPQWLRRGAIRFTNVSARYQPHLPPAISDVSFHVKPGKRVGICGRSGSGKSTLLGVMWRLIDFEAPKGGIFIDGHDIRDIPLQLYRSAMSIIPQDPLVLEISLRDNLDPEGLHSDAEIWEALERSQLKAHVDTLPGKLDEVMAGDGGVFSRGQRQLLALARAILRRRPILALDEATSSIDARTDADIQQTIRTAFDQCTVITIAHRISTIIDYDVIIVMHEGQIVEMGDPQDLLLRPESAFRRLAVESGAFDASASGTIRSDAIGTAEQSSPAISQAEDDDDSDDD